MRPRAREVLDRISSRTRWRIAQEAELRDGESGCIPGDQFSRDGWNRLLGVQDLTLVGLEGGLMR